MIDNIELFVMVLSVVFILRFLGEFVVKLLQTSPKSLEINKYERVFLYIAISYIITYIII